MTSQTSGTTSESSFVDADLESCQLMSILKQETQLARDLFEREVIVTFDPINSIIALYGADNLEWHQKNNYLILRIHPDMLEYSVRVTDDLEVCKKLCAQLAFEALPSRRMIDMLAHNLLAKDLSLAASPFGGLRGEMVSRNVCSALRKNTRNRDLLTKTNEDLRKQLELLTNGEVVLEFNSITVDGHSVFYQCRLTTTKFEEKSPIACTTTRSMERIALISALSRVV